MSEAVKLFDHWIDTLREEVIQGEYGYERGEFDVCPEDWQPMFEDGLTPSQAFRRALDAFGAARDEDDRLRAQNWERIQAEDAAAVAAAGLAEGGSDDHAS